jgi:exopolysaccharide production protein ExoZ
VRVRVPGRRSVIKELVGIQYLRGVAATLVVLHHLYFSDTQLGPFGVKVFFVISGFVMWFTTAEREISPISFWRRRLTRIVPLYWLFLSLLTAIVLLMPQYLNSTVITPENVAKSFLFIPHYHAVQKFIAPILIPGWSLNYEMFFYFIFGVVLLIKSAGLRAIVIGVLLGILVLLGWLLNPQHAVTATYTSPDLLLFLYGILLAIIYRAYNIESAALGVMLIGIAVLSCFVGTSSDLAPFENFMSLAPALIVAGSLALEPSVSRKPSVVLHTIGNASYSIYLSHLFLLRLFDLSWRHFVIFRSGGVLETMYIASSFIFAMAGGVVVHYLVERPMLHLFVRSKVATNPA